MNARGIIAVMVRVPVAGAVKTRLIPALGAEGACRLYCAMVEDLLDQVKATGLPLYLLYTGGSGAQLPRSWQQAAHGHWPQRGVDLGARMAHALAVGFEVAEQVLLVGSDIPDMGAEILVAAAAALDDNEVVLAPAEDGGYCLLGCNRGVDVAPIFQDMPWSTDQVFAITHKRLTERDLRIHLLPSLRDIDTPAALRAYQHAPHPAAQRCNRLLTALLHPRCTTANTPPPRISR